MAKNFPFYHQLEEMDCGATCLRMVARYYGRYYSLEYLRELTYLGKQGVTLLGISDAAETLGLQTLALRTNYEQLRQEIPLPCILPYKEDHFVVLHHITDRYIWIADPAAGKFKFKREEFLANWADEGPEEDPSGVALVIETTPAFYDRDKEGVDKSSLTYVFQYFFKYRQLLLQLLLGFGLGSTIQIVIPFLIKSLVDIGVQNVDYNFVLLVVIAQFVLFVTQVGMESLRRWILLHVGVRVNISLISDFLIKLTRLPLGFFDTRMTGDLLQRITDHERVQRFFTSTTLSGIFGLINFVAFSLVLYFWNPIVLLVFLGGTLLNLGWVLFFQRRKRELDYKRFDQSSENQSRLIELIEGMQEIKLHNAEKQKRWAWERVQARLFRTGLSTLNIDQAQRTGSSLINESKNLFITLIVATAVLDGNMTLGMLVAIHYVVGQLNSPISRFVEFMRSYQETRISLERMNEIHTKADEEKPDEKITILPELGDLTMENVSFRYQGPHSPKVLRNVNVRIPRGKVTAIIGSSGSGKTTLLKLLLGFYQPTDGTVRVGDVNLNTIASKLWRSRCGIVLQDGYIYSDTIAKNIALGEEIIDKRRLLQAVKMASIQTFVEGLPMGYNTPIGQNGIGLSQGQKQRILIARLAYKNPAYIFLDEATTALDAYNEMLVMENLLEFFQGKTLIIVAHRLSTIMNADHVIVVEEGEVVEQGVHNELMYNQGAYYQMVRNQTELGA